MSDEAAALTLAQAYSVRRQVAMWLRTKADFERAGDPPELWASPEQLRKLADDAEHSGLLVWLVTGHEPLLEPPLLQDAQPVYPWESD